MKFNNLLCVKSLLTIIFSIGAIILTCLYPAEMLNTFQTCLTMIITFYFAHQYNKLKENNDNNDNKNE